MNPVYTVGTVFAAFVICLSQTDFSLWQIGAIALGVWLLMPFQAPPHQEHKHRKPD